MKSIRWGIIGCGDVTEVKSGPGFYRAQRSQLVAVMRRRGELAEDFARRHGVARWSDDADDIVHADDVDAVYVATRPDSHRDYVLRCAAAGKPVCVGKPMAPCHSQCVEMVEACASAGVPLWVGYYRRALPRFLAVKALLEQGAIGEVRAVQTRRYEPLPKAGSGRSPWQVDPAMSTDGLFFDGACHTFDFLDYLFGPVVSAHGEVGNRAGAYPGEDTVSATFRFASGVIGSGFWCYAADARDDTTAVFGASGRISFSTQYARPIRIERADSFEERDISDPEHVHQPMIQSIVDELNGEGHCASTGVTGARTAWVMDEILAGFRAGRAASRPVHEAVEQRAQ